MQIDLSNQGKKIRWAVGRVLSGAELPAYHWGQVKWEVNNKFQENCSKANTPIWWGRPCGPQVGVSPPQIEFYQVNLPRGATFVCWPSLNSQCVYPHLVGRTLRAPSWGEPPTNRILPGKPTPRSNFCLLAPAKLSMQIPSFGWVDPAGLGLGWAPHK
jgi:hypothetical protein